MMHYDLQLPDLHTSRRYHDHALDLRVDDLAFLSFDEDPTLVLDVEAVVRLPNCPSSSQFQEKNVLTIRVSPPPLERYTLTYV
mmetsp:Transcript_19712/g.32345  ORF Transcript_19712/g.32345 Transcript_19712/m.32345 type:complete len:83 (-) Transcript_19712:74-322(-)